MSVVSADTLSAAFSLSPSTDPLQKKNGFGFQTPKFINVIPRTAPDRIRWSAKVSRDLRDWLRRNPNKKKHVYRWLYDNTGDNRLIKQDRTAVVMSPSIEIEEYTEITESDIQKETTYARYRQSPTRWMATIQQYIGLTLKETIQTLVYGPSPIPCDAVYYLAMLIEDTSHPPLPFRTIMFMDSGLYPGKHYLINHPYLDLVLARQRHHQKFTIGIRGKPHANLASFIRQFQRHDRLSEMELNNVDLNGLQQSTELNELTSAVFGDKEKRGTIQFLRVYDMQSEYSAWWMEVNLPRLQFLQWLTWTENEYQADNTGGGITDAAWFALSLLPTLCGLVVDSNQAQVPLSFMNRLRHGFPKLRFLSCNFRAFFGTTDQSSEWYEQLVGNYMDAIVGRKNIHTMDLVYLTFLNGESKALQERLPALFHRMQGELHLPQQVPITAKLRPHDLRSFKLYKWARDSNETEMANSKSTKWVQYRWFADPSKPVSTPTDWYNRARILFEKSTRCKDFDVDVWDLNLTMSERKVMQQLEDEPMFDAEALKAYEHMGRLYKQIRYKPNETTPTSLPTEFIRNSLVNHRATYVPLSMYRTDRENSWPKGWNEERLRTLMPLSTEDMGIRTVPRGQCLDISVPENGFEVRYCPPPLSSNSSVIKGEGKAQTSKGGTCNFALKAGKQLDYLHVEVNAMMATLGYSGFSQLRAYCALPPKTQQEREAYLRRKQERQKNKKEDEYFDKFESQYKLISQMVDQSLDLAYMSTRNIPLLSSHMQRVIALRIRQLTEILYVRGWLQSDMHAGNIHIDMKTAAVTLIDFDLATDIRGKSLYMLFQTQDPQIASWEHALAHEFLITILIHNGMWWSYLPRGTLTLFARIFASKPEIKTYPIFKHLSAALSESVDSLRQFVAFWWPICLVGMRTPNWTYLLPPFRMGDEFVHKDQTYLAYECKYDREYNDVVVVSYETDSTTPELFRTRNCRGTGNNDSLTVHLKHGAHQGRLMLQNPMLSDSEDDEHQKKEKEKEKGITIGDRVRLQVHAIFTHDELHPYWLGHVQSITGTEALVRDDDAPHDIITLPLADLMKHPLPRRSQT